MIDVAWVERRLPKRDLLRTSDVAAALDVSRATVAAWIDSGCFPRALNLSIPPARPTYRIPREDVVDFIERAHVSAQAEQPGGKG